MTTTATDLKTKNSAPIDRLGNSDYPQEAVERKIRTIPERYRNAVGKYKIDRLSTCVACGRCAEVCPYGVHAKPDGYTYMVRPQDYRCIGPECSEPGMDCVSQCPVKALRLRLNPTAECIGDPRWSSDLILSTWNMAETGHVPPGGLEYRTGASGGGFDKLRIVGVHDTHADDRNPESGLSKGAVAKIKVPVLRGSIQPGAPQQTRCSPHG